MFPSRTSINHHISENTLGKIINEKLGYKGKATPHGFRIVASSLFYENNFNGGAIETQLAHGEEYKIKGVAESLPFFIFSRILLLS